MDHATTVLKRIKEPGKYVKLPNVVIFDAHEEYDENGNLVRRFGREELQELCDVTNGRAEGGDPTILGLGHTIPRDPVTRTPVTEDKQPRMVGYALDLRVGQYGPHQKTGILVDYYIEKDKLEEWKTYTRGRSVELWPKKKVIDWVASLRKAPQRDLGQLDLELLSFSRDSVIPFIPKRKYFSDAAKTRQLAMAQRGEKLFYAMDEQDANVDSDGENEDTMNPTKPPDAAAPDDDFSAKIDRYMAEKFPVLQRMCQEATQRYAMESNPNAVGAPEGAKLAMDAPGGDAGLDAPGGDAPDGDDDSTEDDDDGETGPGFPGATNTSVPGGKKKKKKKGAPMADDKTPKDDDKKRLEADGEAIRYARLEEEVKLLKSSLASNAAEAKKAKATQRIQALQFQGFTLDPGREVERYCALDEGTWDKEDEHIKRYYKQDSVGQAPVGGMIATLGVAAQPPATKGRMSESQMRESVKKTSKGVSYEDAAAQVLAGQV